MTHEIRIGIDIGGTFTDFVVYDPGSDGLHSFKLPSTPDNPALAVIEGLATITRRLPEEFLGRVVHGSTVATNALLERKGARTALITTRGFKDLLQIGRQNRPVLYDFFVEPPPTLVPEELRLEVDERVSPSGQVLAPVDLAQTEQLASILSGFKAESVAVCLLFSFLHPDHEGIIGEQLRKEGFNVSLSSEILPEYREFERASTTTVNAYVAPVLDRYLRELEPHFSSGQQPGEKGSPRISLRVMQSNGGQISVEEARRQAVRCILSGPAGGIIGAMQTGQLVASMPIDTPDFNQEKGFLEFSNRLITFDMGGTSTDVSLIDGNPIVTTESVIGGCPIRIPVLDIHTIGAGGGSIAYVDPGGALRVGPQSAGADPGPACYGRSMLPTVTDANIVLGRLAPDYFLGGNIVLYPERSHQALERLGNQIRLTAQEAALGVIEIVNAHMERALRLISVERGQDPGRASGKPFTLLSFGGAGGLHSADLARRLNIPFVRAPSLASTLSAYGMLSADIVKDYMQTVMLLGNASLSLLEEVLAKLVRKGLDDVISEGALQETITVERLIDVRYKGQSYELTIPFSEDFTRIFHLAHQQAYGYSRNEAELEVVNVRVRAVGEVKKPHLEPAAFATHDPSAAFIEVRQVTEREGEAVQAPFYQKERLTTGNRINGPSVVAGGDATLWIPRGDRCEVDGYGNLIVEIGEDKQINLP